MATITIAGNSYVITSTVSMADLETVKKYRPSALAIVDSETKETLFKVGIGSSSVSDYGVSFGGASNDDKKLATATLSIPADIEDAKEYVLDKGGLAIANLNKVEAVIAAALDEIDVLKERYRRALEFMEWFRPAWDALGDDERYVLSEFYREDESSQTAVVQNICDRFCIERSSAYNKKNRALAKLTLLLYGK